MSTRPHSGTIEVVGLDRKLTWHEYARLHASGHIIGESLRGEALVWRESGITIEEATEALKAMTKKAVW